MEAERSVEPSSMTMNSNSRKLWLRILSTASAKKRSPLKTLITTETIGVVMVFEPPVAAVETYPRDRRGPAREPPSHGTGLRATISCQSAQHSESGNRNSHYDNTNLTRGRVYCQPCCSPVSGA